MNKYTQELFVFKRDGSHVVFDASKIYVRIQHLSQHPYELKGINSMWVAQHTIDSIKNDMKTSEIDNIACNRAMDLATDHPEFTILAARITISNHQKQTKDCFSEVMSQAYNHEINEVQSPLIDSKFSKFVHYHRNAVNQMIDYNRDFRLTLFGFSTLMNKYLIQSHDGNVIESPQDLWMRVACFLHMNTHDLRDASVLEKVKETYDLISQGYLSQASPTLFNCGTKKPQLLSCFLTSGDDSTNGIMKLATGLAHISKHSGGIGFHWNVRASGDPVKGINGKAAGPIPMLKILESTALAFDQGGKRPGSFASYMSPFHPDFIEWVKCRRPGGKVEKLFYACWIPDIFMKAVQNKEQWHFVSPNEESDLYETYGDEQANIYKQLIEEKKFSHSMDAIDIWEEILLTQTQTGMPYMVFSDQCNRASNHKNLGVIKSSNLCAEIIEYSDPDEWACCVLGTLCLPKYVDIKNNTMDYELLAQHSGVMAENLNRMIDINWYPVEETRKSNMKHRPISIGIQGLADVFMMLGLPFISDKAKEINKKCAEYIYYGALRRSCDIATKNDTPYESFYGSDFSKGILQFHYYPETKLSTELSDRWEELIIDIKSYGTANSLVTGYPPTASSSQIQGNNECFEPMTYIGYTRKTLAGDHYIPCEHFVKDLMDRKIYSKEIMDQLKENRGSVRELDIPDDMKEIYKTAFEISNKELINMAVDRQAFIDQSQSLNQWVSNPNNEILTKIHFHAWKSKLKTGMYYLKMDAASTPAAFGQKSSTFKSVQKPKTKTVNGKKYICDDMTCCSV